MSIWNLLFSDKSDDSYEGEMIVTRTKIPTGHEESGGMSGCILPKNMGGCLFYLFLLFLGLWAMTDYSQSSDEPDRVRICSSGSILPWDSCR